MKKFHELCPQLTATQLCTAPLDVAMSFYGPDSVVLWTGHDRTRRIIEIAAVKNFPCPFSWSCVVDANFL